MFQDPIRHRLAAFVFDPIKQLGNVFAAHVGKDPVANARNDVAADDPRPLPLGPLPAHMPFEPLVGDVTHSRPGGLTDRLAGLDALDSCPRQLPRLVDSYGVCGANGGPYLLAVGIARHRGEGDRRPRGVRRDSQVVAGLLRVGKRSALLFTR